MEIARLVEISDNADRGRQTLAYLNTLPPWSRLHILPARLEGQAAQPIGKLTKSTPTVPVPRTPETQIAGLLRHAFVTRVTLALLADQIAAALRGGQESDGNQLAVVLQLMSEVGEVQSMIGTAQPSAVESERFLRLLLATEAAQALTKKHGFVAPLHRASGAAARAGTVALVAVGGPSAAIWFLGAEDPLVTAHPTAIGRLP